MSACDIILNLYDKTRIAIQCNDVHAVSLRTAHQPAPVDLCRNETSDTVHKTSIIGIL